jgi:D-arabinose 1-dehydrogenase-like Zn-dependent alcohol dehydrogenase
VTAENSRLVCSHCLYCMTGNCNVCTERRATGYACGGAMPSTVSFPRRGSTYFYHILIKIAAE